jgi:hypothetical protein
MVQRPQPEGIQMRKTKVRIVGDPALVDKISEVILVYFELAEDMQTFDHAVGRDYSHSSAPGITYYLTIKKPKEPS